MRILDEVEKGCQGGEAGPLGRLCSAFGKLGQEIEDILRGDRFDFPVRESSGKLGQEKLVANERIFFVN